MSEGVVYALLSIPAPDAWVEGIATDLLAPGQDPTDPLPLIPGFGDDFGEDFGGGLQNAPSMPLATVPDDGGDTLEAVVLGAPNGVYRVRVGGVSAYSGVPGQGARIYPTGIDHGAGNGGQANAFATRRLRFVVPALETGEHDVEIDAPDGQAWVLTGAVVVVRRPRRSRCYSFRALFPPGSYEAFRGLVDPQGGEVFDP